MKNKGLPRLEGCEELINGGSKLRRQIKVTQYL